MSKKLPTPKKSLSYTWSKLVREPPLKSGPFIGADGGSFLSISTFSGTVSGVGNVFRFALREI